MPRFPKLLCLAAVLLSSLIAFGQTTFSPGQSGQQNPYAKEPPHCSVSGSVVNAVTGEGIPRAQVMLFGNEARTALTDGEGRFSFEDVTGWAIAFQARKPGFTNPLRRVDPRVQACASNAPEIKVQLLPTSAIVGHITDPNGEPVDDLPIRLGKYDYRDGMRHFTTKASDTTNFEGKFRLGDLEVGSYVLIAGPSAPQMMATLRDVTPTSYFPGVPDRASAATIVVKTGATVEANMVVKEVTGYKVTGRVLGASPELRGVSVELKNESGDQVGVTIGGRGSANEFSVIGVPAGQYRVHAIAYEQSGVMLTGSTHVVVSHDVSNVQVSLAPMITLKVNVRSETGDATQSNGGGGPMASVRLIPVDGDGQEYSGGMRGGKDAKLTVSSVEPGRYMVSVDPINRGYAQSARLGSTDLLREPVMIDSDADPIEITLRDDGAELSGSVENGMGALIVAIPSDDVLFPPRTFANGTENSTTGKFRMNLPPGEYTLYAFNSDGVEYSNPKVMEKYSSQGVHVSVSAREKKELSLRLIEVLP